MAAASSATVSPPNTGPLVRSDLVAAASLHRLASTSEHLTIAPFFGLLYPLFFYAWWAHYAAFFGSSEITFLTLVLLVSAQALAFLIGEWNIAAKAWMTCFHVHGNVDAADRILVIPPPHSGSGALCPIIRIDDRISFTFQQQVFLWDAAALCFKERSYLMGNTVHQYKAMSNGLATQAHIDQQAAYFGLNLFNIPIPKFLDLFKEHAIAPFFVFQVFCVTLWALDEYWYYSLFTLAMLAMFESTVVGQRLRTLQEFRSMAHPPRPIYTFRCNSWSPVLSDQLLPGDVISLPRAFKDDHVVPCDVILVSGSIVVNEAMLSGESTPLHKESIHLLKPTDVIDDMVNSDTRLHTVYSGTKILQATPPTADQALGVSMAPDSGALGVVVRTGFGTTQGKLVRMMVFSSERVSANNLESFLFIAFLLVFAIAAASYVWIMGQEHGRPTHKLLLDCILIVTSVVPPELPMELSMAVNTSLMALSKHAIFCTEPFRIPFAGKLDILCFDKTGTITGEDLVVEGISGFQPDLTALCPAKIAPVPTIFVLASAHSLVKLDDGTVVGDPMERATLAAIGFSLADTDRVFRVAAMDVDETIPLVLANAEIQILRKFAFSSALKRMSTIARVPSISISGGRHLMASVKGAPETILSMLREVPTDYTLSHKKLARNGGRVLALAFKLLDKDLKVTKVDRSEIECGLEFAGFLVFSCPLKQDSASALTELSESGHRCTMITGDAALTACHVAKQVAIVTRSCLILDGDATLWRSVDESAEEPLEMGAISSIVDTYDLCVTGTALDQLGTRGVLDQFAHHALPYIYVWARVSPNQKEWILTGLKGQGFNTLMCGDGTNDVGALKQAHVGVALLDASPEDLQKIAMHARYKRFRDIYAKQVEWATRFGQAPPPRPASLIEMERQLNITVPVPGSKQAKASDKERKLVVDDPKRRRAQKAANEVSERMMQFAEQSGVDMEEPPSIKFGDASVAAPFTSKLGSLNAIANVIKQGRCTLVTTLQMYKILALNCLISAYAMSVLFLDGMKWGDWQMTIQGMMMAACFYFISRGKPIERLAQARPMPSFFNAYALLSVVGQFAVHAVAMWYVTGLTKTEMGGGLEVDFEGKKEFVPNLLNSGVYLLTTSMQVSTFAINYIGRPFRESIRENVALFRGLLVVGSVSFLAAMEVSDALNEWLQLVPFPSGYADTLTAVMAMDFSAAYVVEVVFHALLARSAPRSELRITYGNG